MTRRLLNLLTIRSSLLFVAVAGLFVRDRFRWDTIGLRTPFAEWLFWSRDGSLAIARAGGDGAGLGIAHHQGWDWQVEEV